MTIELPSTLERELLTLAGASGKRVDVLVEEAVRQYLDALAITDVSPKQVATTQTALIGELKSIPLWYDGQGPTNDEAR